MLSHPESLTTLKEKFAGGCLLESTLSALPKAPEEKDAMIAWVKEDWQTIELSESQREACKKAVTWAVGKGLAPTGAALNNLIEGLGLNE